MNVCHKPGQFTLFTDICRYPWPYSMSFEWGGEIFVVHRGLFCDSIWITSHKETGCCLGSSRAPTARESICLALELLECRGEARLKEVVRRTLRRIA